MKVLIRTEKEEESGQGLQESGRMVFNISLVAHVPISLLETTCNPCISDKDSWYSVASSAGSKSLDQGNMVAFVGKSCMQKRFPALVAKLSSSWQFQLSPI